MGTVLYQHALFLRLLRTPRHSPRQRAKRFLQHPTWLPLNLAQSANRHVARASWRWDDDDEDDDDDDTIKVSADASFNLGVALFNKGEYYQCHDVMESMWMKAAEPKRTVVHAILQCAVGLYHLLNQNHRGAMTELGEGLTKLRRQRFIEGPFHEFEQEVSEVLEYIYNTQLEYAACTEDLCVTMDGSKESYQLLRNFAAGQPLYDIRIAENGQQYIFFNTPHASNLEFNSYVAMRAKVKVPFLNTSANDLCQL